MEETEKERQENPKMEELRLDSDEKEFIHDDPSPRGVLEIPVMNGDSDTSSSSSFSSCSTTEKSSTPKHESNREGYGLQWRNMIDTIKKKSARRFSIIPLLTTYENRKNLRRRMAKLAVSEDEVQTASLSVAKPSWRNFSFEELAAATDNFSPENMIGKGGNAEVYKGCLPEGEIVAVKKLMSNEKEEEDRVSDFLSELGIIAHVNHQNAARLIGFSTDCGLHFVLEFLPHGSLASLLFSPTECLEWKIRFKVAIGVADGLRYLHHDCQRRIIHRDIKASNILLTEDFEAQISDFGLAKWLPENWPHHIVYPIEGTFGYLAPEYFMHGIVDEKTDIFAFGVLLLELITGRRAVDTASRQSLVMWAKPLLEKNNLKDLVDPRLGDDFDLTEMRRSMLTASLCINHLATMRPSMNRVVHLLRGEDGPLELQKCNTGRAGILEGCDLQDYTCASYLDELTRHRQLVME